MEVLARSRLTSKEQLSLPAAVRRLLGVRAGDELVWMKDADGRLVVRPGRRYSLQDIRDAINTLGAERPAKRVSAAEMKRAIARHARERHGGR